MTFADTVYTVIFDTDTTLNVIAENYDIERKIDERMLDYFLESIEGMKGELATDKRRAPIFKRELNEDFSYIEEWSYPLGVYKNQSEQISCDGFCPEGTDKLKNKKGKIKRCSMKKFYALVDTTHQFHSLQSTANQYEYVGSDFMLFTLKDRVYTGVSGCDAGTHSSLHIEIEGSIYTAWVTFTSIMMGPPQKFELKTGNLILEFEKNELEGILKGKFDFTFENTLDPDFPLTWKGTFYSPLGQ